MSGHFSMVLMTLCVGKFGVCIEVLSSGSVFVALSILCCIV